MHELPQDVPALFVLALVFGYKHGLDPDHLATIDGLSRFNATGKPRLAKWAGALFALMGVSRLLSPALEEQIEYAGIWPGMLALLWVIAGFALALSAARANKVKVEGYCPEFEVRIMQEPDSSGDCKLEKPRKPTLFSQTGEAP